MIEISEVDKQSWDPLVVDVQLWEKMSSTSKGTRKTYSFEEREILIQLINKYEDVEDRKSDPSSMCKRKSAWARLSEDYNSLVGPDAARSSVQLRRCWENMKACKRNREERKYGWRTLSTDRHRRGSSGWQDTSFVPKSCEVTASTIGLPPNVVFEPKASEPFTLQSVPSSKSSRSGSRSIHIHREVRDHADCKEALTSCRQIAVLSSDFPADAEMELEPTMSDCTEKFTTQNESSNEDNQSERDEERSTSAGGQQTRATFTQTLVSPRNHIFLHDFRNSSKVAQREEELHILALSEAQMRVDVAAMQKEEAKMKLEEVQYRKEEARMRMLFITCKLDRLKQD